MRHCIFLAYSVGDSSVSEFFSLLALKLSEEHRVVVFSDRRDELPFASDYVKVVHWPSPRPTKYRDYRFLRKQIKIYRPKIMLSTFGANNLFLLAGYLSGVPHRIATHRTISSHFKASGFKVFRKKMVLRMATCIITNSGATRKDVIATFGVSPQKVRVVYNAVKNPHLSNERDPNLIVYAGRLTWNKGVEVLLKAFRIVVKISPELKLKLLGGTSSEVETYQKMASELGLQDKTTFLGSQPKETVLEEFSKARYVVVPSLSEGFGFVVIEAFSVRTPVIGSNTGGIKEIIRNGIDGLLFEPGNHSALAKAMRMYDQDPKTFTEYGENAYQRFLNTFELDHVVNELKVYLSNLITPIQDEQA